MKQSIYNAIAKKVIKHIKPITSEIRDLNFEYYYKCQKSNKRFRKNQLEERIKERSILSKLKKVPFVVGYDFNYIDIKYYGKLYSISFSSHDCFSVIEHKGNFITKAKTFQNKIYQ